MLKLKKLEYLAVFLVLCSCAFGVGVSNERFNIIFDGVGVTSLKKVGDPLEANFISENSVLGNVFLRYRNDGRQWKEFGHSAADKGLEVVSDFKLLDDTLTHEINIFAFELFLAIIAEYLFNRIFKFISRLAWLRTTVLVKYFRSVIRGLGRSYRISVLVFASQ